MLYSHYFFPRREGFLLFHGNLVVSLESLLRAQNILVLVASSAALTAAGSGILGFVINGRISTLRQRHLPGIGRPLTLNDRSSGLERRSGGDPGRITAPLTHLRRSIPDHNPKGAGT